MDFLQSEWGWTVVTDLFMGGLGAGLFFVAALVRFLGKDRFKTTVKYAAWISAASIAVGVLCLLLDVGQPLRAMLLPAAFTNFGSWMVYGSYLMFCTLLLSGLYAVFATDATAALAGRLWKPLETKRELICAVSAALGGVTALGVTVYTGFLLAGATGIPFWDTWLLPATFTASSLFMGTSVALACVALWETDQSAPRLRTVLGLAALVLAAVTAAFVATFLQASLNGSVGARAAGEAITGGAFAPLFWGGLVMVGLVVPLAAGLAQLAVRKTGGKGVTILAATCAATAAIGGITWRYMVVAVAAHAPLASPSVQQMFDGVTFMLR